MTAASQRAATSVEAALASQRVTAKQRTEVKVLVDRLYGHIMRVVDLERLFQIEQCVWSELDRIGISDDEGDLASALLAEALHRVAWDPERQCNMIPLGILEEEVIAANYDDGCLMCRHDVADHEYRMSGRRCADLERQVRDKEWMAIQRKAANAWRAKHANALRRFGLADGAERSGESS